MKIFKGVPFNRYLVDCEYISFIDRLFVKPKREQPGFNRGMFDEDFARIFHSANQRGRNFFSVESNDDELTQKLFGNVKTRNRQHLVDEKIRELVEEIAQSLICFGTAYYFLHNSLENEDINITPFSSENVFRILKVYFQLVPKRRERHWNCSDEVIPRELRILDGSKLIGFIMPRPIRRMLSEQNRVLALIDKYQFDRSGFFPQTTHENPYPRNDFDFRIWKDAQEQALYRATRVTGWNGRNYDSSKRSDFFQCYRLIRFRRNQLILRDYILSQLSNEFTRVGCAYNKEFLVAISPTEVLPQVNKLDELDALLSREEVSITKVLDYCYEC